VTKTKLDIEIYELTIKLNKAITNLTNEGDGFIDKKLWDIVYELNELLSNKINLKNQLK
jgi:hypothetical protein